MSKVKTITTVAPVKVAGMEVGSIMQDKDGYFYRAKGGISGPHDWRKDNDHRPTIDDVKQDLPPGATIPQVKAPQANQGKGGDAKTSAVKPAPHGQKPQAKTAQEAPQEAAQAKEPAKPSQSPQVKPDHAQTKPQEAAKAGQESHKGNKPDPSLIHATASGAKPVAPGNGSKVRHKLVEMSGPMGLHFWLYAGYKHSQGFKWNGSGGFMFLTLGAAETFLIDNGIELTDDIEKVDVTNSSYDPNKGVTPNDDPNGQRNLL